MLMSTSFYTPKHTVKDSGDTLTGVKQPSDVGQIDDLMLLHTVQAVQTTSDTYPHQRTLSMPESKKQLRYSNVQHANRAPSF